jgi:hypothetical protein
MKGGRHIMQIKEMMTKAFRASVREGNRETLKEVEQTGEDIERATLDVLRKRHAAIKSKIGALQEERAQLLCLPLPTDEFQAIALEEFRKLRKKAVRDLVGGLLETQHAKNIFPFQGADVEYRLKMVGTATSWLIPLLAATEEDVIEVCREFPEQGISSSKREAKIKAIDKEISDLTAALKQDRQKAAQ